MFFFVSRLIFATDKAEHDHKLLSVLAQKIRQRFKVCVKIDPNPGKPALVITGLGPTSQKLSEQLDEIASFCETSGFGSVDDENTILDYLE